MALGALVSRTGASSGKPLIIQDFKVGILRRNGTDKATPDLSASSLRGVAICSWLGDNRFSQCSERYVPACDINGSEAFGDFLRARKIFNTYSTYSRQCYR